MWALGGVVQLLGVGLQFAAAQWFGRIELSAEEWRWIALCILLFLVGALLLMVRPYFRARASRATDRLLSELGSEVAWFAESTGKIIAEASGEVRRKTAEARLEALALSVTKTLSARHEDGRATIYELAPAAPWTPTANAHLRVAASSGRFDRPRPFDGGTGRGDAALEYIRGGYPVICQDVDDPKEKPDGWEGTGSDYKSFFSCPIALGQETYGMLTYDVPATWSFSAADGRVILTFAAVAGLIQRAAQGGTIDVRIGDPDD